MPDLRPLVVDTDGGVDDAAALWYVLGEASLAVVAITVVWGNVDVDAAAANVLRVLHAAGRPDIPVALGANAPYEPAPDLGTATHVHGSDGLGDAGIPAAPLEPVSETATAMLSRVAREHDGHLALLTLGPLTNIAAVLDADAGFAPRVAELVVMGGSVRAGGNALPAGEANIGHDPIAAQRVVTAPWPTPPLLVGLDVTMRSTLSAAEFDLLDEQRNPAARFLAAPLRFYRGHRGHGAAGDAPCHDLLAAVALAEPGIVLDAPVLPLAVDCAGGPAWGATIADFRAAGIRAEENRLADLAGFAPWRIALATNTDRFRAVARALFGG